MQTCLNSPDPPPVPTANCDQRMSATGYEETELTYNVNEEEQQKVITTHLILFYIYRSQNLEYWMDNWTVSDVTEHAGVIGQYLANAIISDKSK